MAQPRFQFGLKAVFAATAVVAVLASGWMSRAGFALSVLVHDLFFWLIAFWLFVAINEVIGRRESRPRR